MKCVCLILEPSLFLKPEMPLETSPDEWVMDDVKSYPASTASPAAVASPSKLATIPPSSTPALPVKESVIVPTYSPVFAAAVGDAVTAPTYATAVESLVAPVPNGTVPQSHRPVRVQIAEESCPSETEIEPPSDADVEDNAETDTRYSTPVSFLLVCRSLPSTVPHPLTNFFVLSFFFPPFSFLPFVSSLHSSILTYLFAFSPPFLCFPSPHLASPRLASLLLLLIVLLFFSRLLFSQEVLETSVTETEINADSKLDGKVLVVTDENGVLTSTVNNGNLFANSAASSEAEFQGRKKSAGTAQLGQKYCPKPQECSILSRYYRITRKKREKRPPPYSSNGAC